VGRKASLIALAALAGGAVAGYAAERALMRRTRVEPPPDATPLGTLAGDLEELRGPEGLRLTVEAYGPAGAPQLVLAHGWLCTGRVWHEQVVGLADRFRIVTYDQPGHGRSSAPASGTYDVDMLGDALWTVIEEATGPGPVVLVGHSLGGMAALNTVARHADALHDQLAGVVLMSTLSRARAGRAGLEVGLRGAASLERLVRRAAPTLRRPAVAGMAARLYSASSDLSNVLTRSLAVGPDTPPEVVDLVEQQVIDSDPDVLLGLSEAVLGVDEDRGLAALTAPTAIVVGAEDRIAPPVLSRRMASRCHHAELHELPGVRHFPQLEAPEVVNAILARFATGEGDGDEDARRGGGVAPDERAGRRGGEVA
jgi:pimeloyl-ACP methyl ester carboxylesterase